MLLNIKKKDTAIPLDKFLKIIKPKYVYIKITPDKSISNYNSSSIAKAIKNTYRSINKRIRIENKKLWVETNFKIAYIVDIRVDKIDFIFMVPEVYQAIIKEKIMELWPRATLSTLDRLEQHSKNSEIYQLSYKNEDALSLSVDKRTKEPLNSILSTSSIMKDNDRVTLIYNFQPKNNFGWQERYDKTMIKLKEFKSVSRDKESAAYIFNSFLNIILSILDTFIYAVGDFVGADTRKLNKVSFVESIMSALKDRKDLSIETKKKKDLGVLDCQIAVISESLEDDRRINNAMAITQSFRTVDNDNELISKKVKKNINIEDYNLKGVDTNTVSTDECINFIQIPSRAMLKTFKNVEQINVNENIVPFNLIRGTKRLGTVKCKGNIQDAFLDNEYNTGNLPLTIIGGQGGGKSTYFGNYASDCSNSKEGLIVIDFIKKCELSDTIKKCVPADKIVEIDLGIESGLQGLGYNEIVISNDISDFEKLKLASLQSQQIMSFIDSISVGDPLSSRMRRFLNAAANVSLVLGYSSVKEVISCLEDFKIRDKYINKLTNNQRVLLEDEIKTLNELNEFSKVSKKEIEEGVKPEVIGTKESKIEHILDRVSMLREDFKMKYMYNKDIKDNINLVNCMEEGKIVLIKMKESDFPNKMIKNILVTYWVSKIWLASQIRGMIHEKPLRCNILIDEVFQAPTCMSILEYILPQSRKFACKFVFSTQYIRQLEKIFDTLEASGSSYMLLKGCLEDDFKHFKSKLEDFDFDDIRDMPKFHSLNLIYHSNGYSSFISKLPKPL